MPLLSRLFRGDLALEACLVHDAEHVVPGSMGSHVGKIQLALQLLDSARIVPWETHPPKYGPSTASAVLAFKRKRQIINYSYETEADNIVGKMTISALDQEILMRENGVRRRRACGDPVRSALLMRGGSVTSTKLIGVPTTLSQTAGLNFSKKLGIIWQTTRRAAKKRSFGHLVMVPVANELLEHFGMVVTSPRDFMDTIPHDESVDVQSIFALLKLRQVAENSVQGYTNVLRVIVCPIESGGEPIFGQTSGGPSETDVNLAKFFPFVLINARILRHDKLTLLHEMIHAATGLTESDHDDKEPDSVFSTFSDRSILKRAHAEGLSKSFFASPK